MSNRSLMSAGALIAAIVLFFAANIVAGKLVTARADLTEGKLYTLSPGSKHIATRINEPIKLTLYMSKRQAAEAPGFSAFSQRVREILEEFERSSAGKIKLAVVDPEPFSEAEDQAVSAGVQGMATRGGGTLYFGLVGKNATDQTEIIPFLSPDKEETLEYDISRLVYKLSDIERKKIGVMSWLPIAGTEQNPMMGGRGTPAWQIDKRLKEAFDVKQVATTATEIPADIKVLVIVHPKSMAEKTQYAVDQFVLRGGRVMLFVDPQCDADVPPGMNQFQAMQVPKNSDLPKLMAAWGVEMDAGKVAADLKTAVPMQVGQGRQEAAPYVCIMQLGESERSKSDPVTSSLERTLLVGPAGVLRKKADATTDVQPMLMTSNEGTEIESSLISFIPDIKKLAAEFKPGDHAEWLAVRVSGKAKTAFPDGAPKATADPSKPDAKDEPSRLPHIAESAENINIVIVSDCDMLTDRYWIQAIQFGQTVLGYDERFDNGTFVVSTVDNLSGSSDLMSLRARGKFSRPFTRIEELEKKAAQKYRAEEQTLQKDVTETQQKINEMQRAKGDSKDGRIVLSPEQKAAIDGLQTKMLETRKKLRDVKFNLDKDTRNLQTRLMAINIGLVPALVGIFAIGLAGYRAARRTADRQTASKG